MNKTKIIIENFIFIINPLLWILMSLNIIEQDYILICSFIVLNIVYVIELTKEELISRLDLTHNKRFYGGIYKYIRILLSIVILSFLISENLFAPILYISQYVVIVLIYIFKIKFYDIL